MTASRIHENDRPTSVHYETIDEAIADAMRDLGPGGVVRVHTADCEQRDANEAKCTCTPMNLVVGPRA